MNSIFHRTSVRTYSEQRVEQEKIVQLLRAAMAAPSAANQQPWEYYVVTNRDKLEQLSQSTPYAGCVRNASVAFVPCYRKASKHLEYAQIDMSASVENLLLEADELELGAVWIGIAPQEERMNQVREILDIPKQLEAFAIISCGYPVTQTRQQDRYEESRVHYIL